jgi:leucyl/phenylalanyl-tRNA--protein transferase
MSLIPWLESDEFPPIETALDEPNGLLAAGGDLSAERLLNAYRQGIFPWFDDDQPILWWSPDPRAVLFTGDIHISRSLKKRFRRGEFQFSFDRCFSQVIDACGAPRSYTEDTWITDDMKNAYGELHQQGFAHSLEVWQDESLVGGLYGVSIGKLFFGESMFSRTTDASKAAFVVLAKQCEAWNFGLIDCQISNPHLSSMGASEISRQQFKSKLNEFINIPHLVAPWTLSIDTGAIV